MGPGTSIKEAINTACATGCVGAFLFIMIGYIIVIETINQAHNVIVEPPLDNLEQKHFNQAWLRTPQLYGAHIHPLDPPNNNTSFTTILYQHNTDEDDDNNVNTNDKKHTCFRSYNKKYERTRF